MEQEPVLFGGTVADNIRYGRPEASHREVEDAAAVANASAFVEARIAIDPTAAEAAVRAAPRG